MVDLIDWVRDPQLCWCWQFYLRCVTTWMTTCPLSVKRLDTARHVIVIFLFKSFIPFIFHCLSVVQKHVAQICGYITLTGLQTFYHISVFNSKTHKLKAQKYDVSMTSLVAKNIYLFHRWNTSFLLVIPWKFCGNLNIFHGDLKGNMSGCFFLNTVYITSDVILFDILFWRLQQNSSLLASADCLTLRKYVTSLDSYIQN